MNKNIIYEPILYLKRDTHVNFQRKYQPEFIEIKESLLFFPAKKFPTPSDRRAAGGKVQQLSWASKMFSRLTSHYYCLHG